ncbi:cytochrome c oxidase subunit VIIc [Phascolomyces articulosus]|uniref:Cytochrome c oxidase subunit 8, mitochondrial n=1 Tax=Phascolomyces articulosus TaxID=60185 RepID=A0AAD5PFA4_9FUNG|nr:cytochrome c oxidase subunit VIIc [Phascolomyces articulosus]
MHTSVLGRTALRSRVATRQLIRSDLYHFENSHGQNLPFKTTNRAAFAVKFTVFMSVAFGAPFAGMLL